MVINPARPKLFRVAPGLDTIQATLSGNDYLRCKVFAVGTALALLAVCLGTAAAKGPTTAGLARAKGAALHGPRSGLLPIEGDPGLASQLDAELDQALAARNLPNVLGPAALQLSIAHAAGVRAALDDARKEREAAAAAAIQMQRGAAVQSARQAIETLKRIGARHHARAELGRAYGELGLALLLRPKDERGARQAFEAAVATDGAFVADPDRSPPTVAAIVARAQRERKVRMPLPEEFAGLGTQAQLPNLLWLKVSLDALAATRGQTTAAAKVSLELVLFSKGRGIIAHHRKSVRRDHLTAEAADWIEQMLRASHLAPPVAGAKSRSWYQKWWVWTLAAGVGAGILTAALLAASSSDPPPGYRVVIGP